MRVTNQILDSDIEALETRKSVCQSLGSQVEFCVANFNYACNINVLYISNSISKFTIIFHFWRIKVIFFQRGCRNEFLFIFGVCSKICISISEIYSREPFIYYFIELISMINTEATRRLTNPKILLLKDR